MSYFLNLNKITTEDIQEIKHLASSLSIDFDKAMWMWMETNPNKIEVLGEMKDGEFIRDEIDENGIKEYKGKEGIVRMIEQVLKNEDNDNEHKN